MHQSILEPLMNLILNILLSLTHYEIWQEHSPSRSLCDVQGISRFMESNNVITQIARARLSNFIFVTQALTPLINASEEGNKIAVRGIWLLMVSTQVRILLLKSKEHSISDSQICSPYSSLLFQTGFNKDCRYKDEYGNQNVWQAPPDPKSDFFFKRED